jgi:hypothetical protein
MEIQSIQTKPDPYGIKANDEYDYPYTHNYLFGKFTKVFLPEQTNSIVSGEMHDVVSNLKQGKPKGIAPWNKGKTGVYSPEHRKRISEWRTGVATTKGKPNPQAADNARKGAAKLSAKAKGRTRLYKEDGTWTWQYP